MRFIFSKGGSNSRLKTEYCTRHSGIDDPRAPPDTAPLHGYCVDIAMGLSSIFDVRTSKINAEGSSRSMSTLEISKFR